MRRKKRLICILLSLTICMAMQFPVLAQERASINDIDKVLLYSGTPLEKLDQMDEELKRMIYEISGTDIAYVEMNEMDMPIMLGSNGYNISDSDLKISVSAYKSSNGQVSIYPSYE